MAVNRRTLLAFELVLLLSSLCASATVILSGGNIAMTFEDVEANFAPPIKSSVHGAIYTSDPLNACSNVTTVNPGNSSFLLIVRGGCTFNEKVIFAQDAGYDAAIIYDYVDGPLIAMAGDSSGVRINAVFISKKSGETLKQYSSSSLHQLWIVPNYENSVWSIMAISIISLLAMSAVLATCFFVRAHRVRRPRAGTHPAIPRPQEFRRMSSRSVKSLPSLLFTTVQEDNCTSVTCAICLDDYVTGDKLRILPCRHKFHALCIDCWLMSWRTFCPVCKRDAKNVNGSLPASESTPLLSSTPPSLAPSPISSPLPVGLTIPRPPRSSRQRSPFIDGSGEVPSLSSQRTANSYLLSPRSIGYPSVSSLSPSFLPYVASGSNLPRGGSASGTLPRGDSVGSLDRFGSGYSLPDTNGGL